MNETLMLHVILFLSAALSIHLVSWIGSVLHSVPNTADSGYAVFTFRSDQNTPMSTNILMNIMFPNVLLIMFNLICYYSNIPYQAKHLFFYAPYYYLYRLLLICIILRRRELYNLCYELVNTSIGIIIAFFLTKFLLTDPEQVFIPISDIISEFWLIILLLIYKFIIILLDKLFTQKTVVGDRRLNCYICNRFDQFLNRYKDVTDIGKNDQVVWILLYSIMIFEDYNRTPLVRKLERLKLLFHHTATVGIMQITSKYNLSDQESIIEAYNLLRYKIMQNNLTMADETQIAHYAYQYNSDENYSKSVSYIYAHLYTYISKNPKYSRMFNLEHHTAKKTDVIQEIYPSKLTIDDLVQITGKNKKEIYKKIKQEKLTILLLEDEVNKAFDIHHEK